MANYEFSIRDYWRIIIKRVWFIGGIWILVILSTTWMVKYLIPKVYTTSTTIAIEIESTVPNLMAELFVDVGDRISTTIKLITSRKLAQRVAIKLSKSSDPVISSYFDIDGKLKERLYQISNSPEYEGKLKKDIEKDIREEVLEEYARNIAGSVVAEREGQTDIIRISTQHSTPEIAAAIANTVADEFKIFSDEERQKTLKNAEDFIKREIKTSQEKWQLSAVEMKQFEEFTRLDLKKHELETKLNDLEIVHNQIVRSEKEGRVFDYTMDFMSNNIVFEKLREQYFSLKLEKNNLLKKYLPEHPKVLSIEEEMAELNKLALEEVKKYKEVLEDETTLFTAQTYDLEQELNAYKESFVTGEKASIRRELINFQIKRNETIWETLNTSLLNSKISEKSRRRHIRVIDRAPVPESPSYPDETSTIIVGIILGLILGMGFAFVMESLDTSIGTIEDVEEYVKLPVLGVIPNIKTAPYSKRKKSKKSDDKPVSKVSDVLVAYHHLKDVATESFRTLRTNIQFTGLKDDNKAFLITSAGPQEGKSTVLSNLSITMAQKNMKTVIVSANMRRPSLHRYFGLAKEPGLSNILTGRMNWRDTILPTGIENLDMISCGPMPPNPSELLSLPSLANLVTELKDNYDAVIFDSPPILPVTDSAILASRLDGVIIVYFVGKSAREALLRAKVQLENANANIWGVCLNHIMPEVELGVPYYHHYYYRYYGESRA